MSTLAGPCNRDSALRRLLRSDREGTSEGNNRNGPGDASILGNNSSSRAQPHRSPLSCWASSACSAWRRWDSTSRGRRSLQHPPACWTQPSSTTSPSQFQSHVCKGKSQYYLSSYVIKVYSVSYVQTDVNIQDLKANFGLNNLKSSSKFKTFYQF